MAERAYIPGEDDANVLALRARVWGEDHPHTNAAFYEWLFQKTPEGLGTGIVSERDGEAIGFAGIANRRAQMGERSIRVAHGLDFMVDPNVGKMLSGRVGVKVLNRHVQIAQESGYDCNLNYPNDNSHRMLVSKRVKYTPVFYPDLYGCALGPANAKDRGFAVKAGLKIAGGVGGLYTSLRSIGHRHSFETEIVDGFDARFDAHWDRVAQDGKLRFVRDAKTLNWRYTQHPLYSYTTIAAVKKGQIVGYVVVSKRELFGIDTLLICDLCVSAADGASERTLLEAAKDVAKQHNISLLVSQALSTESSTPSLLKAGFVKVPTRFNPKSFRMIAVPYSELGERVLSPDAWSFAWGDMDVI